jgi:hypothetical protein
VTGLPLTGGCLCGGVRYEVSEPLVVAGYCHCARCRRRTGAAAYRRPVVSAAPWEPLPDDGRERFPGRRDS